MGKRLYTDFAIILHFIGSTPVVMPKLFFFCTIYTPREPRSILHWQWLFIETNLEFIFKICRPNSTIHLNLEEVATECIWDNLYIYDGKSVKSPLIAVIRYWAILTDIIHTYGKVLLPDRSWPIHHIDWKLHLCSLGQEWEQN